MIANLVQTGLATRVFHSARTPVKILDTGLPFSQMTETASVLANKLAVTFSIRHLVGSSLEIQHQLKVLKKMNKMS